MKSAFWKHIAILLIAFGLFTTACAGGPQTVPTQGLSPVFLTNEKSVRLLPPEALGKSIEMRQSMDGYYQTQTYSFEAYVKAEGDAITLVALSGFGTEVYNLTYRDTGINFTAVSLAGPMKPEYLVADFELCYFPAAAVGPWLEASGFTFTETTTNDGWSREIRDGATSLIRIFRRGNTLEFKNLLRGYGYTIQEAIEEPAETTP